MKFQRTRAQWLSVSCAVVLVASLSACAPSGSKDSNSEKSEVTVGMLQPLTGAAAAVGKTGRQGAELAVEQINKAGGIDGTKIVLKVLDAAGDVATGNNAFAKISAEKPVALLGPNYSAVALSLVPRLERAQLPMLSGALSPDLTSSGSPWVFRVRSSDVLAAQNLVDFAVNNLKLTSIAVVNEESDYGQGGATAAIAALKAAGVDPVFTGSFAANANDLSSLVLNLKDSGAESVIYWGSQSPAALFAKQTKQLGFEGTILGSNAYTDSSVLDLAGAAANGIYAVVNFVAEGDDPDLKAFVDSYKAKYGEAPDSYAGSYFDAMNLLAAAMKEGGTTPKEIAEALKTVEYKGVAASYKYHNSGEMAGSQIIVRIVDGAVKVEQQSK